MFSPQLALKTKLYLWTFQRVLAILFAMTKGKDDIDNKPEPLPGVIDGLRLEGHK